MAYHIVIKRKAQKELEALPKIMLRKVVKAIDNLAETPIPTGSKKLRGTDENFFRLRVGDYRIIYSLDSEIQIVEIRKIGHRKDVYRL